MDLWSTPDLASYLVALHVLKTQYPDFGDRIDAIVSRYDLIKLNKDEWLWGSGAGRNGLQYLQEGLLGYEQYATYGLKLRGVEAENALYHPPTHKVTVDSIELTVDQRDFSSSWGQQPPHQ